MTDTPGGETDSEQPQPLQKSGPVSFFSTPTGRVVMAGIALFVVVVALGAIAFFFLFNSSPQPSAPAVTKTTKSVVATVVATPMNPPEVPLDETFTFRNIFAPSVSPEVVSTPTSSTTSSGESSSTTTATGPKNTLVLTSIASDSGVRVATFVWDGAEYTAQEGDQVDSSPWKVVTLSSDSAVMLYGDSRITLTVGQGFQGSASITK